MKTALRLMALMLVVGSNAMVQKPDSASELTKVVETERAFARASEERGIRESFLAYIAEDGLLFRPGAVNGKKWMLEHPVVASQKRPLLSWQPAYADVARAGDLGYTSIDLAAPEFRCFAVGRPGLYARHLQSQQQAAA